MGLTGTDVAQRRLLEALSEQNKTAGGITGLLVGLPYAIELADQTGQPALAEIWRRFSDLARAVQVDLRGSDG